jgi:hypothetical protein
MGLNEICGIFRLDKYLYVEFPTQKQGYILSPLLFNSALERHKDGPSIYQRNWN